MTTLNVKEVWGSQLLLAALVAGEGGRSGAGGDGGDCKERTNSWITNVIHQDADACRWSGDTADKLLSAEWAQ
jgi:hypothetical protein